MSFPAPKLVILIQTAHLDWDWLLPFPILCTNQPPEHISYFHPASLDQAATGCASDIFTQGGEYLSPGGTPNPDYFYSVCEMGFLRSFSDQHPERIRLWQAAGANVEILGGGITSPDNLLPHGEAFIRNYITGNAWMQQVLKQPVVNAWLPDDFGHDAQLPALLEAMGLKAVAFERVPGSQSTGNPIDGSPSVAQQLQNSGVDFIWTARDGSMCIAHWLQYGYGQGSGGNNLPPLSPENAVTNIAQYIRLNSASSPTPFLLVPVGGDFNTPINVAACVNNWNNQPDAPATAAQMGTFNDFVNYLAGNLSLLNRQDFHPTPYWTGFFVTRPRIKRLHYETTRALLGAEIFTAIAGYQFYKSGNLPATWTTEVQARASVLEKGWNDLAPSTHHDFITGTSIHYVYYGEQLPRLAQVYTGAVALRSNVIGEIAAQINPSADAGETPVAVFNQLGFSRTGLVELTPGPELAGTVFQSVRNGTAASPVQPSAEGGWLFFSGAGSMGYSTCYLSTNPVSFSPAVSLQPATSGSGSYTLTNEFLSVVISADADWNILSIVDRQSGSSSSFLGGQGNCLVIYNDGGDNYRYGNENSSGMSREAVQFTLLPAQVLEAGPLRVRVLTQVSCTVGGQAFLYTREYILVAGESFVRMRTTGAAPFGYSVMTEFQFQNAIGHLAHGTTYHWDDAAQVRYWQGPNIQCTHDFVIVEDSGDNAMGVLYHGSMPGWGQADTAPPNLAASLDGGLFRNPGGNYFGWVNNGNMPPPPNGIDPDVHTIEYALGGPSSVASPATSLQLTQAMQYHTPLLAAVVPFTTSAQMKPAFSLASVSAPGATQPILTAAKPAASEPNDLILRIYQPSNDPANPLQVTLDLSDLQSLVGISSFQVTPVTALENDISGATRLPFNSGGYQLSAARALITLRVQNAE